eukprot:181846-Lingulodinium_polyedra.AAC.1
MVREEEERCAAALAQRRQARGRVGSLEADVLGRGARDLGPVACRFQRPCRPYPRRLAAAAPQMLEPAR